MGICLYCGEPVRGLKDAPEIAIHYANELRRCADGKNFAEFCKELGISESQIRTKKFCWLPTAVYDGRNYRAGIRWLSYAWLDRDGRYYTRSAEWLTYVRKKRAGFRR